MTEITYADGFASKTLEHIRRHGWSLILVGDACDRCAAHGSTPVHTHDPGFAYSVGVWMTYNAPEVIMTGAPPNILHHCINRYVEKAHQGHPCVEGRLYDDFVSVPVQVRKVRPVKMQALGEACTLYHGSTFPAVQLVVPDNEGCWPWERGCEPQFKRDQRLLCYPPQGQGR